MQTNATKLCVHCSVRVLYFFLLFFSEDSSTFQFCFLKRCRNLQNVKRKLKNELEI